LQQRLKASSLRSPVHIAPSLGSYFGSGAALHSVSWAWQLCLCTASLRNIAPCIRFLNTAAPICIFLVAAARKGGPLRFPGALLLRW